MKKEAKTESIEVFDFGYLKESLLTLSNLESAFWTWLDRYPNRRRNRDMAGLERLASRSKGENHDRWLAVSVKFIAFQFDVQILATESADEKELNRQTASPPRILH